MLWAFMRNVGGEKLDPLAKQELLKYMSAKR